MTAGDHSEGQGTDALRQCAVGVVILAVCAVMATQLGKIYVEPADSGLGARGLPSFAIGAGFLLAIVQIVSNLPAALRWARSGAVSAEWRGAGRVAALVVLAFAYIEAILLFQYALPTAVAMSLMLYLFGSRGIVRLVVFPIVAVAVYYFVFFVLLGLFEEPGSILRYDSYSFALQIRHMLGLQ
ncbi:hypothetical protein [Oricola sp.]|uniref:tripartite tricarboxylate transporter TctB family protein n=1 Tax=Oricola sp. TaxID=1979950 RepID=UPI0025F30790|nr:hypothetical protein [Oricola sp.]MCI5077383.1 hypothetical protein [Oricola sp.]